MSTQMVASARAAAAKEAQDAADAGQPLARPQQIKLPQMEVSAISTTVDGSRECCCVMPTIRRTPHRCSIRAASATGRAVHRGPDVNFEPTGNDQGWQLKDNQGPAGVPARGHRPARYLRYPALSRRLPDQEVSMFRCLRVPLLHCCSRAAGAHRPCRRRAAVEQQRGQRADHLADRGLGAARCIGGPVRTVKAPFKASERNGRPRAPRQCRCRRWR